MRRDRERLLDIMEAIERIEKYAARGRDAFEQEERKAMPPTANSSRCKIVHPTNPTG